MKRICFIYDKVSQSFETCMLVVNHAVAVRHFVAVCSDEKNKDLLFVKFPSDYELVTLDFSFDNGAFSFGKPEITPFTHFVGKGDTNGE